MEKPRRYDFLFSFFKVAPGELKSAHVAPLYFSGQHRLSPSYRAGARETLEGHGEGTRGRLHSGLSSKAAVDPCNS